MQCTRPWTSENINNNRPGYIILESATFSTQAIQIQISLLIFVFSVAERKSKVSRNFVPWQPPVLLLSSVVVAVLFCFPAMPLMVATWCTFHDGFLEQSEPLWSAYAECSSFLERFLPFCFVYWVCYTWRWLYLEDTSRALFSLFHIYSILFKLSLQ